MKEARQSDGCRSATKCIIRKRVQKYKFLNDRRKRKAFISENRRLQWVREYSELLIDDGKDVVLPDKYCFGLGNDSKMY